MKSRIDSIDKKLEIELKIELEIELDVSKLLSKSSNEEKETNNTIRLRLSK